MKYFLGFLLGVISACDMVDDKLCVINESNNHIVLSIDKDSLVENEIVYSVKVIESDQARSDTIVFCVTEIRPGQSKKIALPGIGNVWKRFVTDSEDETLNLFVFNRDTILQYDYETVIDSKMYDLEQITLEELRKNNWTIKYQ